MHHVMYVYMWIHVQVDTLFFLFLYSCTYIHMYTYIVEYYGEREKQGERAHTCKDAVFCLQAIYSHAHTQNICVCAYI